MPFDDTWSRCFEERGIFQFLEKQTLRLLYVDLCRKLNMICGNGEKEPLKATFDGRQTLQIFTQASLCGS